MNQIRYFSLLGLFILLCYAAPASLWVDSLKGQTLFEKLSGLSKRNRLPHVDLNTRIAYHTASIFHEAKKQNWYYYALGTEVNLNRFIGFLDFMYSSEDLDRTGIISEITANDGYDTRALDTRYLSLVLHLNYRVLPKLNLFAKGMYETASVEKASDLLAKGKYRTSWGYLAGIEYYPMEENLHFFLNYIGRSFQYTTVSYTHLTLPTICSV